MSISQTVLYPGDIVILSMASNLGACGLPPESDEFSFVCFKDIETGTVIDITDNAWEHTYTGFWGDGEGTLRVVRTGATIPQGTVITMQCLNYPAGWNYRVVSPDNDWAISNINVPGGPFNIDDGGDQIYFMQGGEWDNQGGGGNRAKYDGRIIFGATNHAGWTADGTNNDSNLHPEVQPCYYMQPSGGLNQRDFMEYAGPVDGTDPSSWLDRIQNPGNWIMHKDCIDFNNNGPYWTMGASIDIGGWFSISCGMFCGGCAPVTVQLIFNVPPGSQWDVVYTNGTDTITVLGMENWYTTLVTITDTVSYWFVSVTPAGGDCPIYSGFSGQADLWAFSRDPGLYNEITVCESYTGAINLFYLLNGTPETGGMWYNENTGWLHSDLWLRPFGQGLFTYYILYDHGSFCEPPYDTASIMVRFIEASPETTLEIECSQNGTPNNIYDDQIVITLNFLSDGFGDAYTVSISSGTITPSSGLTGVPTVFTLSPGSALGPDLVLTINGAQTPWCEFKFPIPAPGFCSDPCDYDMTTAIVGTNDICLNNCPEEPASIEIEVSGGTPPFKMDFQITAPGHPAVTYTGVNVQDFNVYSICIDSIPAPVFNAATGSIVLPATLTGSGVTFTLLSVYDKFDCTSNLNAGDHYVNLHDLPAVSTPSPLILCRSIARNIDLTEYDEDINPFYDVTWFDGSPFLGGEQIFNPTAANLENIVQLWAYIEDDYCENAIQVPFMILPEPHLNPVPPLAICDGSSVSLQSIPLTDIGNSMAIYSYHTALPPDSSNILNPASYIPPDSTRIYILATAGMCYDTIPLDLFVEDYPDFSLQAQPCDLLAGTYSVLFTSSADSIYASLGTIINSPTGQDSITGIPNNTPITIEVINPTGLCKDTFQIVAPNCDCPVINSPITSQNNYTLCEGGVLPIMSVTVDAGLEVNWYTTPSGGVSVLQNSLTFQPSIFTSGTYYAEAIDPSSGCYSIRTAISLQVHPLPQLVNLDDPGLCEGETLNFSTLMPAVSNGVAGSGIWYNLSTQLPVSGTISPQNGDSWYYVFTTTAGGCTDADTITATVHDLPTINLHNILCDDVALTFQLQFTSDADVVVASAGNLVHVTGTDSFYLLDIPFNTDIQLSLQNLTTGCSAVIIQPAPDCSCPPLLQNDMLQLCSDQSAVNLGTLQGPGVNGTWEMVSTPPGLNPATLTGSNFQGAGADPGLYRLRFIRSVLLADCIDTADVQVQLQTSPFADAGSDALVCAPDVISLLGNAGGSGVQFSWQTNGGGLISNPNSLTTSYTPTLADISAGAVSFTLTVQDPTGFCPSASETITVTIDGSAYFVIDPQTPNFCDTSDVLVDMDALISFGTTNGVWFFPDTVSAPVTGSSQINPSTLTPGNYTIFYTTSNAVFPCQNDTTAVNLIIENCSCPSVAISTPAQKVCSKSDALDLSTLVLTSEPGTWSITSFPPGISPAVINGNQFVAQNADAGIYRLRYTLSNPQPDCPPFAEINLEVVPTPVLSVLSSQCAPDLLTWQVVISSSSAALMTNLGALVPLGNSQYRVENVPLNTSIQLSASDASGQCIETLDVSAPDCDCTIRITNLPDEVTLCPQETIVLTGQVQDPKGPATSYWVTPIDTVFQTSLAIGQPGTYQFVTTDELGCSAQHIVDVMLYEEMVPSVSWLDITCPGDRDGEIVIQAIDGGNGPFMISVNNGSIQAIASFPHMITGLGAGPYRIEILDALGCTIDFNIQILSASSETLQLGPDQTILAGDSLFLHPLLSFVPDSFYWTGDTDGLLDPKFLDQWIQPATDQVYQLYGIDSKGCVYSDEIRIRVLLSSSIYIPNIFSPNGDGINDILAPMTDPSITVIQYFEVYSRWGELVYSARNFAPNQSQTGWDGTKGNKRLSPGVYVYRLGALNKRDKEIVLYGDVTLMW